MLDGTGSAAEPWLLPYGSTATAADIFYCFRLLLGRNPHREEWRGHSARAGEDLPGVVASYLNSLEFSRRGLLEPSRTQAIRRARIEGFDIFVALDDAAVGKGVAGGSYEPEVTAVFRRLLRPGMGVLDLGANIGYFTLLSASIVGAAGYVLAIEPNPRNVRLLEASRRANGFAQVTISQTAAGRDTGLLELHSSYSNGTTSDLSDAPDAVLGAEIVACVRADALLRRGRRIDLIKADVEGAEYNALLGCRQTIEDHHPVIVSEFSPGLMPGISGITGEDYLRWLIDQRYLISTIQPDGSLRAADRNWRLVLDEYGARGVDHLDIVATPHPVRDSAKSRGS